MRVYTAPEKSKINSTDISIFLAGSIEQGKAALWQDDVIKEFKKFSNAVIFNPRRKEWDASLEQSIDNTIFKQQVEWELKHIYIADIVLFYFQPDTMSPISLLELGLCLESGNHGADQIIYVVCPKGFYRKGNVDIVCKKYGLPVYENMKKAMRDIKQEFEENSLDYEED